MENQAPLPTDWRRFLDQVQKDLGILLDQAQTREVAAPPVPSSEGTSFPVAEIMRQVHDGMDARLRKLDRNLTDLDQHLAQAEDEAQRLQQSAHELRDPPADSSCSPSSSAP